MFLFIRLDLLKLIRLLLNIERFLDRTKGLLIMKHGHGLRQQN